MDFTDGEKISLNSITSISINKRRFLGNELIVNGKSVYSLGLIPVEFAEQLIELLKSNFSIN
jgi:hypothetical protein